MIPNQRRSMMRSSFFVVLYAQILLITQYVYGMNMYESELPTKVTVSATLKEIDLFVKNNYLYIHT